MGRKEQSERGIPLCRKTCFRKIVLCDFIDRINDGKGKGQIRWGS